MTFKIEVVEDGFILTKNEFQISEQKKVYFEVDSLVEELRVLLDKIKIMREEK